MLEGEAGFYHAYAGNNRGELRYSFTGNNRADLAAITEGLGRDWMFLETLYRIYSTAGYNIAHVDVTARLCEEHGITYEQIDRIEAVVNWIETEYPSPAFPIPSRGIGSAPEVGSTPYFTAYGAATRGYPMLRGDPRPRRERPARGARPDAARDADPDGRAARCSARASRSSPRTAAASRARARAANSSGISRKRRAASARSRRALAIGEAQFDRLIDSLPPSRHARPGRRNADRADDPGLTTRPRALVAGH